MRAITVLFISISALLLGACQQVADVSALPEPYRSWFVEAAAIEFVDTTAYEKESGIEVRLDYGLKFMGDTFAGLADIAKGRLRIRLNPDNMRPCWPGGLELKFKNVSRHELRHTMGIGHSSDPSRLMYPDSSCYPID